MVDNSVNSSPNICSLLIVDNCLRGSDGVVTAPTILAAIEIMGMS